MTNEEEARVRWAIQETLDLAGGCEVISDKDLCKVIIPGFHNPGEVDAECPGQLCSFDVKSGQEYRYYNQQACYAYGQMLKHFATSWTVWILYMDLRKRVRYYYTFETAKSRVESIVESYNSPGEPKVGQFCGWCANFEHCPAQRLLVDNAMSHLDPKFDLEAIKDDPEKLAEFLTIMHPVAKDGGWYSRVKGRATELASNKTDIPGWMLVSRQGNKYVHVSDVNACGELRSELATTVPVPIYEEFCKKYGIESDQSIIKQGAGYSFLQQSRKKK